MIKKKSHSLFLAAPFTLLIVLLSILSIYVGIIKSAVVPVPLPICIIDKGSIRHVLKSSLMKNDVAQYCHNGTICHNEPCPLWQMLCVGNTNRSIMCDDLNQVSILNGISGLSGSQLKKNLRAMHMTVGEIHQDVTGRWNR
jgi:hypothetical protein